MRIRARVARDAAGAETAISGRTAAAAGSRRLRVGRSAIHGRLRRRRAAHRMGEGERRARGGRGGGARRRRGGAVARAGAGAERRFVRCDRTAGHAEHATPFFRHACGGRACVAGGHGGGDSAARLGPSRRDARSLEGADDAACVGDRPARAAALARGGGRGAAASAGRGGSLATAGGERGSAGEPAGRGPPPVGPVPVE
mmetsp:Transcript_41429/g.137275  ORF Transcript_41429/g.137275 Transcript_41429/m.137275 type:complete len:200 (-) Transcript_41429:239-838(-)